MLDLLTRMRPHATVTYDVNARPAITGTGPDLRASVEAVVAHADVVKASDEDLHALHPDADPVTAAQRLLELGPSAVVVTRGAEGATWVAADGTVDVPAPQTVVVDTIAAGDTFGAALVDGLWTRGLLGAEARPALAQLRDVDRAAAAPARAAREPQRWLLAGPGRIRRTATSWADRRWSPPAARRPRPGLDHRDARHPPAGRAARRGAGRAGVRGAGDPAGRSGPGAGRRQPAETWAGVQDFPRWSRAGRRWSSGGVRLPAPTSGADGWGAASGHGAGGGPSTTGLDVRVRAGGGAWGS